MKEGAWKEEGYDGKTVEKGNEIQGIKTSGRSRKDHELGESISIQGSMQEE